MAWKEIKPDMWGPDQISPNPSSIDPEAKPGRGAWADPDKMVGPYIPPEKGAGEYTVKESIER